MNSMPHSRSAVAGAPGPARVLATTLSGDADEHAQNLNYWDQTYYQISRGRFSGRLDQLWLGELQIFRERTSEALHEAGSAWPGSRIFGIPLAQQGQARVWGQTMACDALFTMGSGDEFDLVAPPGLDIVGLAFPQRAFARAAAELEGHDVEQRLQARHLLALPPATMAKMQGYCREIFHRLDEDDSGLMSPHARRVLGDALLDRLLEALAAADSTPLATFTTVVRRELVRRAREFVLSRPADPVTVVELCRTLKVSRRTLQYCFQEVLGVSPNQYLRVIRLNGMRRDLRRARTGEDSVSDVAARWGFWHLSSCAADYRKLFGELPSVTLKGGTGEVRRLR